MNSLHTTAFEASNYFALSRPELVQKSWGYELIVVNNEQYCGKLLHFVSGHACSVHTHRVKHETFFLSRGLMEIYYHDDEELLKRILEKTNNKTKVYEMMEKVILQQGMSFTVPVGRVHQMVALEDSDLFEFSTQDFAEDSYRLIKGY